MTPAEERIATVVEVAYRAAEMHGSSVELAELKKLLPEDATPSNLESSLGQVSGPVGHFELKDGIVTPKGAPVSLPQVEALRRSRALANIDEARVLANKLRGPDVLTVAVSGSTSYMSAGEGDDIDLFCITRSDRMWVFLAKALILSRVRKVTRVSKAPVTFSCVLDEDYARAMFKQDLGPLLARDALNAEVVVGEGAYKGFLESAGWIGKYFPRYYGFRLGTNSSAEVHRPTRRGTGSLTNRFLYIALGTFIRTKAAWHNKLLSRQGKDTALFEAKLGDDHMIYESMRYRRLKRVYAKIGPLGPQRMASASGESKKGANPILAESP